MTEMIVLAQWLNGAAILASRRAAAGLVLVLIGGSLLPAKATDTPEQAKPMALTGIMRDLGQDMQDITDDIAREDWSKAATLAMRIADHPQPPLTEKLRILAFVGRHTARFRSYDEQAHNAAQVLAQAATRADGTAAIGAFAEVQMACLGCHQQFRKPFREHFHDQH